MQLQTMFWMNEIKTQQTIETLEASTQMKKISPFCVATAKCREAVSGCVLIFWFWLGFVGFELFSRGGWPVGKTQTGRKSGFTCGPCPGLCHNRVPPWWLWEKGAGHDLGCQHPLEVEHHFRGDTQDFAWSFLGQKPEGNEWEISSDQSTRKNCSYIAAHCFKQMDFR